MGIDPGSRFTGFGIIDIDGNRLSYLASGHIKVTGDAIPEKLGIIFSNLLELLQQYSPDEAAIEKVFMHRNPDSALKLGQARGAAITAVIHHQCSVAEYSATQIKQSVVGKGNASKDQIQHMVKSILNINTTLQEDAADALAIAICHSHHQKILGGSTAIKNIKGIRGGRIKT
ncbi:Crossover junction endodeoxyribonuclease RuvC [hydrothermal vent metagenome]|uniref:Crossover junction endodeoxyribonuclease RuvC n=1 Tax=hydrothermal vent metagenome TaxID=652676 RepID=A0A3B0ZE93_9ZZZZ